MKRHRASLALLFGPLAVIAGAAVSGRGGEEPDWPRWLGPAGDGIARESGWRPESLVPSPKIVWRTNVGYGYSSVCIKGPYLYTMGNVDKVDSVYCLSVDDGREVWCHSYPCRQGPFAGPRATPAFSRTRGGDSLLYTISREGQLYCFYAGTGEVKWQSDLVAEAGVLVPRWGIATSPVIWDGENGEDDLLLLNVGKYGLAADKTSGRIVWQSPEGLPGYASPVLYDSGGRRRMVCFGDSDARGVDVRTGKLLWTKHWFTRMAETSSDPVVRDERVFLSTIYSKGCTLFDVSGVTDGADGTPREVWLNKNLTTKFGTSVLYRGHLYGVHGNTGRRGGRAAGSVRCVEWETGELRWQHDTGFASLTLADNGVPAEAKLVILTEEGTLVIAEARTDGYHELARARVLEAGDPMREAKGKCWTAPVLCRGMIFCRNDKGDLVCVDVR